MTLNRWPWVVLVTGIWPIVAALGQPVSQSAGDEKLLLGFEKEEIPPLKVAECRDEYDGGYALIFKGTGVPGHYKEAAGWHCTRAAAASGSYGLEYRVGKDGGEIGLITGLDVAEQDGRRVLQKVRGARYYVDGKQVQAAQTVLISRQARRKWPLWWCTIASTMSSFADAIPPVGDFERTFYNPFAVDIFTTRNIVHRLVTDVADNKPLATPFNDWSGWNRLRFDIRSTESKAKLLVTVEDKTIAPPLVRWTELPAGEWRTFDLDLAQAASERGLNPAEILHFWISIADVEQPTVIHVDNLRLAKKDAKATYPLLVDPSPMRFAPPARRPSPKAAATNRRDHAPLSLDKPVTIPFNAEGLNKQWPDWRWLGPKKDGSYCELGVVQVGWAAAIDNNRICVGFTYPVCYGDAWVLAVATDDGGRTWRGLEGQDHPSVVPTGGWALDQVGPAHDNPLDPDTGDCLVLSSPGCPHHAQRPQAVVYATRIWADADGWKVQKPLDLVDADVRHCTSRNTAVRLADGRIWLAHGDQGRLTTGGANGAGQTLFAYYSDDDGKTWHSWNPGRTAMLPDGYFARATTAPRPCMTPYGNSVACLWQDEKALRWSIHDGEKFQASQVVAETGYPLKVHEKMPLSAVTLGAADVFVSSPSFAGVMHWDGAKWSQELQEVARGGRLTLCGKATVVLFYAKGQTQVAFRQRTPDGKWSEEKVIVSEDRPLDSYNHDPGYIIPRYSPANYVPLVWGLAQQKGDTKTQELKMLRVPIGDGR